MFGAFDNDNEDDDDFAPSASSKLSSLFTGSEDLNSSSLMYKAPVQPKIKTNEDLENAKARTQASVVVAKVISLFKLGPDKQNQPLGKHMMAVIGCVNQNQFEVIIYKEKNNIFLRRTLDSNSTWYKYPNNYISFYDNDSQFWTIDFENNNNKEMFLNEFLKYKCVIVDKSAGQKEDNGNTENPLPKTKADILSRITKMGQQILPEPVLQKSTSTDVSDSDVDESKVRKPAAVPRKLKKSQKNPDSTALVPNINHQVMVHPPNVVYSQPYPDIGYNSFVIAQNAELKASLAEINYKLNNVLNNDTKTVNEGESNTLKSRIKCLNLKVDNLEADLRRSQARYEELKKNYNEKCKEELELSNKADKALESLAEIESVKKQLFEKDSIIETQKIRIKELEALREENRTLVKEINGLNEKISQHEENIDVEKKIRKHMNKAFLDIMGSFSEESQYDFSFIQENLLRGLKKNTYNLVQDLRKESKM